MVSITLTLVLLLVPHTSGGSNTAVNCGGQSVIFPDVDRGLVCGECKVLVDNFQSYGSCSAYCQTIGRACVGAWEEQDDDCQVQYAMSCASNAGGSTTLGRDGSTSAPSNSLPATLYRASKVELVIHAGPPSQPSTVGG